MNAKGFTKDSNIKWLLLLLLERTMLKAGFLIWWAYELCFILGFAIDLLCDFEQFIYSVSSSPISENFPGEYQIRNGQEIL